MNKKSYMKNILPNMQIKNKKYNKFFKKKSNLKYKTKNKKLNDLICLKTEI
jgi:hypothetical protein